MRWDRLPTGGDGFYWMRSADSGERWAYVVEVYQCDNPPRVRYAADNIGIEDGTEVKELSGKYLFAGPIEEPSPPVALDEGRCAVCGWMLDRPAGTWSHDSGCVRGCCSMRPRPHRWYDPERAKREACATVEDAKAFLDECTRRDMGYGCIAWRDSDDNFVAHGELLDDRYRVEILDLLKPQDDYLHFDPVAQVEKLVSVERRSPRRVFSGSQGRELWNCGRPPSAEASQS